MAVRASEHARGSLRKTSPADAVALWRGLVDGRWSIVDHTETGGRRIVLARRNVPGVHDPKALTARERDVLAFVVHGHSNKYAGYALGLAPTTVADHIRSALAKLALNSRREVIALLGTGGRQASGAPRA